MARRAQRIDVDSARFAAGASAAMDSLARQVEDLITAAGEAAVQETKAAWPLGPDAPHTRDGIRGEAKHTKAGRFVYTVRIPYPGAFREFGTKRQPPRPILRPAVKRAADKIAGG